MVFFRFPLNLYVSCDEKDTVPFDTDPLVDDNPGKTRLSGTGPVLTFHEGYRLSGHDGS